MDTENRAVFAARLREERDRLGLSQAEIAARCGAKPRTYQDWERAVASVSVEFLSTALTTVGLDAVYVLTGVRTPSHLLPVGDRVVVDAKGKVPRYLTPEQEALLDNYNAADERGRAAARSVLDALAQPQPKRANG
ncbi:helix-turn-helix domain-containing protein [Variovorax sp. S2]|uniref:helix-turn-helix domain-containing protein n=1 Tax=Variovorax sp. S12S4 TaxID=3029170 RepID=UPI00215C7FB9|nr:helix-turn-helix transcriptional regulator [Variovorax sp. S12S4]MCR8956292.1 helix-turn-helix domain-containing protein [Variovorax sp. S12S4]